MKTYARWIVAFCVAALLLFGGSVLWRIHSTARVLFHSPTQTYRVGIADTQEERHQGLSGREGLNDNGGLLFIFDKSERHGIVMRDMKFAIDIIWLDESYKVVGLTENAQPDSYPQTVYYPDSGARYVLEMPAGTIAQENIMQGQQVQLTY